MDFVSYYRAGSTWAVKKGNPKKLDTSDMCGAKIAVQDRHRAGRGSQHHRQRLRGRQQGRSDVVQASGRSGHCSGYGQGRCVLCRSPVAGYAISQTDGQLEALGDVEGVAKQGIAVKKGNTQLAEAVQKAVQKLMDDGTYMKILKHWGVESGALDKAEVTRPISTDFIPTIYINN